VYPAKLATSAVQSYVDLDPSIDYSICHTGLTIAGAADTNTIYFAIGRRRIDDGPDPDGQHGYGRELFPADPRRVIALKTGIIRLHFITAAGAPVFKILPGNQHYGTR